MKNKVYIVGNGGREASLRWKLKHEEIYPLVSLTYDEHKGYNDSSFLVQTE